MKPPAKLGAFVEVRGPDGRLYGRLDPQTLIMEVKHKNEPPVLIDLKAYLVKT